MALGRASGRPVVAAVPGSSSRATPKRQSPAARSRASESAREAAASSAEPQALPPPPPPPLTDPVLIDLLHCCLSMQQFAQQQQPIAQIARRSSTLRGSSPADRDGNDSAVALAEAAGVRLVCTALSAMAVLAVAAVPAVAAAAEHAAAFTAAQAERPEHARDEQPYNLVFQMLAFATTVWQDALPLELLPSVVEVCQLRDPSCDM